MNGLENEDKQPIKLKLKDGGEFGDSEEASRGDAHSPKR